jgi:flagellar hook-associated protein 3 FlgL
MTDRVSTYSGPQEMASLIQTMTAQLNGLVNEVSSGTVTDPAATMGTSAALLYQLNTQSNTQTLLQTTVAAASNSLDVVQSVLTSINTAGQTASSAALTVQAAGAITDTISETVASSASASLQSVLTQLNTTYAGASVFAGDSTAQPMAALGDANTAGTPAAALQGAFTGAGTTPLTDVTQLVANINSQFAEVTPATNPPTYSSPFYSGTASLTKNQTVVGINQTLSYSTQANQAAHTDLLKGLSMLSMVNAKDANGNYLLSNDGQSALMTQGVAVLATAQSELTELQGSLGSIQTQMTSVVALQKSTAEATQLQIGTYTQANTAADATQVTLLQTQLEASYQLTATISQLSLTHYMPAA